MGKQAKTSLIFLLCLLAGIAVAFRSTEKEPSPEVAIPSPVVAVVRETPSSQAERPTSEIDISPEQTETAMRIVMRAAPIPVGPFRSVLTVYDSIRDDDKQ